MVCYYVHRLLLATCGGIVFEVCFGQTKVAIRSKIPQCCLLFHIQLTHERERQGREGRRVRGRVRERERERERERRVRIKNRDRQRET